MDHCEDYTRQALSSSEAVLCVADRPLHPRHARFVREYLIDRNAKQAYIRAGYKARGHVAEVNAANLLRKPEVAAALAAAEQRRAQRTEVTADRVVRELARLAFGHPALIKLAAALVAEHCWASARRRLERLQGQEIQAALDELIGQMLDDLLKRAPDTLGLLHAALPFVGGSADRRLRLVALGRDISDEDDEAIDFADRLLAPAVRANLLTRAAEGRYDLDAPALAEARRLAEASGGSVRVTDDRAAALAGAKIVYAKSWGNLSTWGDAAAESAARAHLRDWQVDDAWMARTDGARFMHCLPVRRNVVVADEVLDGPRSVVIDQAENRLHAQTAFLEAVFAAREAASPVRSSQLEPTR